MVTSNGICVDDDEEEDEDDANVVGNEVVGLDGAESMLN